MLLFALLSCIHLMSLFATYLWKWRSMPGTFSLVLLLFFYKHFLLFIQFISTRRNFYYIPFSISRVRNLASIFSYINFFCTVYYVEVVRPSSLGVRYMDKAFQVRCDFSSFSYLFFTFPQIFNFAFPLFESLFLNFCFCPDFSFYERIVLIEYTAPYCR